MTLFGTAGIRGSARDTVTPELALAVGRAVAIDARDRGDSTVVVARDGRTTGGALANAVASGIASAGGDVLRTGRLPTPALAFATTGRRGVMVTASHNPPGDNGLKLFVDGVEYDSKAEARIGELVETGPEPAKWSVWGEAGRIDVLDRYRDVIAAYARGHGDPLAGRRIAVDCGNGTAALATPQVLRELGAEVVTLHANVDGHFPGRESKPTPESLGEFRSFVADDDVAFGIAHDGDGDRIVIVGPDGGIVHEDTILAVLAAHYTERSTAKDPVVVTTPNASGRIDERVDAAGGRVERVALGVLHEGIAGVRESGAPGAEVVFAAEPWKHIHPVLGGWIDGVASAAVLARLVTAAGDIATLCDPVTERPYRKENVPCPEDRKAAAMERIELELPARFPDGSVDTDHGVRIDMSDGSWVLVRRSGTEPYLRVYAESDAVDDLVDETVGVVETAVGNDATEN